MDFTVNYIGRIVLVAWQLLVLGRTDKTIEPLAALATHPYLPGRPGPWPFILNPYNRIRGSLVWRRDCPYAPHPDCDCIEVSNEEWTRSADGTLLLDRCDAIFTSHYQRDEFQQVYFYHVLSQINQLMDEACSKITMPDHKCYDFVSRSPAPQFHYEPPVPDPGPLINREQFYSACIRFMDFLTMSWLTCGTIYLLYPLFTNGLQRSLRVRPYEFAFVMGFVTLVEIGGLLRKFK